MTVLTLKLTLHSDATFGRGDGLAGVVDAEVQHDAYGLPYLGGRALKGLLLEECANILFSLQQMGQADGWRPAARELFGEPGSSEEIQSRLHVSDARLPDELRRAVQGEVENGGLQRRQVLESLTAIRRQTAVSAETGAPLDDTLRAMRVILRETEFRAALTFLQAPGSDGPPSPSEDAKALLGACVKALRRAGTGRNRGRGRLTARLYDGDEDVTEAYFTLFRGRVPA